MNEGKRSNRLRRLIAIAHAVAIGVGLIYGYDIGSRIWGTPLGVLVAVIAAVFCTLLVSSLEQLFEPRAASPARRREATRAETAGDKGQGDRSV